MNKSDKVKNKVIRLMFSDPKHIVNLEKEIGTNFNLSMELHQHTKCGRYASKQKRSRTPSESRSRIEKSRRLTAEVKQDLSTLNENSADKYNYLLTNHSKCQF